MLGELWSCRKFEGTPFVSSEGFSYTDGSCRKFEETAGVAILSLENFKGRFFLNYVCDYGNLAKILGNRNAHPNIIGLPPVHPKTLRDEITRTITQLRIHRQSSLNRQGCSAAGSKK